MSVAIELRDRQCEIEIMGRVGRLYHSSEGFSAGLLFADDGPTFDRDVKFSVRALVTLDEEIILHGKWVTHPKFGQQFAADSISYPEPPAGEAGLAEYLSNNPAFRGIGPAKAAAIALACGDQFDTLIRDDPEFVQRSAKLTDKQLATLREQWVERQDINAIATWLSAYGLTHIQVKRIAERYGNRARQVLEENPYVLCDELHGYGFSRTDEIALRMGIAKHHPGRIRACLLDLVKREALEGGHTYVLRTILIKNAVAKLCFDTLEAEALVRVQLASLCEAGTLVTLTHDGVPLVADASIYEKEMDLIRWFAEARAVRVDITAEQMEEFIEASTATQPPSSSQADALRMALASRISVLSGGAGTGKAQPLDAKILTPSGWRLMGDLHVGDDLVGVNGKSCKVTGIFPQGEREAFRVTMSDGSSTECSEDHLWFTSSQGDRDHNRAGSVKSLGDISGDLLTASGKHKHWIPIVDPIEFASTELPLNPYALGLLLGDGCFCVHNGCGFSKPDESLAEVLQSLLPEGNYLRPTRPGDYRIVGTDRGTNPLLTILRNLELAGRPSNKKFVPEIYKHASPDDRLALLQGLMDSDGSADKHIAEFTTISYRLAEDVLFLVRSLGGTCRIANRQTFYTHNGERRAGQPSYRLCLCLPSRIKPFRLARKADRYLRKGKYEPRRAIEHIVSIGAKAMQCIAVDSPDHLYVTDDFIVTHNTYCVAALARIFVSRDLSVALCAPTGKAAKRMSQLAEGQPASTIHRLLAYNPIGGGFMFNAEHKLDYDLIVCDEVSMCDIRLLHSLFSAIDLQRTQVLLVGDHNQLPPIGAGNTLRDVLTKHLLPHYILTECHRSAGELKQNANAVLAGEIRKSTAALPAGGREWWLVDSLDDPELVIDSLRQLFSGKLEGWGYSPLSEAIVITPQNKGRLGTLRINAELQRLWQLRKYGRDLPAVPAEEKDIRLRLWPGDRCMQIKNDYKLGPDGLMNGTMGVVRDVVTQKGQPGMIVIDFDDVPDVHIEVGSDQAKNVVLAYASTVHKMQGSEYPCVVAIIHKQHTYMLSKSILYTAVTRARKTCIVLGDKLGIRRALRNTDSADRRTWMDLEKC